MSVVQPVYNSDLRTFDRVLMPVQVRRQPDRPDSVQGLVCNPPCQSLGISGVAVPYQVPTTHQGQRELVAKGAFHGTLSNPSKDVRVYTDHRYSVDSLLASRKSGTVKLTDSPEGLRYEAQLPDTERSKHLLALADQGALGASIGFRTDTSTYEMVDGVRHWKAIDLREVSVVAQPAYSQTSVERRSQEELDGWLKVFLIRRHSSEL